MVARGLVVNALPIIPSKVGGEFLFAQVSDYVPILEVIDGNEEEMFIG